MKILGIDPGSTRIGYGLVEDKGDLVALDFGLIELGHIERKNRLTALGVEIKKILAKTKPEFAAVEELFFQKNQKTAIEVAEARGVICYLLGERGVPYLEYGPREIKQALTNDGRADKTAVATMVKKILRLKTIEGPDDVADALAIAITAAHRYKIDFLLNA